MVVADRNCDGDGGRQDKRGHEGNELTLDRHSGNIAGLGDRLAENGKSGWSPPLSVLLPAIGHANTTLRVMPRRRPIEPQSIAELQSQSIASS
jgi:hypothetical protein